MIKELCKDEAILSKRCERATAQDAPLPGSGERTGQ